MMRLGPLLVAAGLAATLPWTALHAQDAGDPVACQPQTHRMALEGRASPYDSTVIRLAGTEAKLCYGRPSARGRTMIGGEYVPYGKLWRTGANEPTTLHLPVAAEIAGIAVEPGSYSIYTVPGESEWTVIVNAATDQWGHESQYTEAVRAREIGRATVRAERLDEHVETMTFTSRSTGPETAVLTLEWEHTRVPIPLTVRRE